MTDDIERLATDTMGPSVSQRGMAAVIADLTHGQDALAESAQAVADELWPAIRADEPDYSAAGSA